MISQSFVKNNIIAKGIDFAALPQGDAIKLVKPFFVPLPCYQLHVNERIFYDEQVDVSFTCVLVIALISVFQHKSVAVAKEPTINRFTRKVQPEYPRIRNPIPRPSPVRMHLGCLRMILNLLLEFRMIRTRSQPTKSQPLQPEANARFFFNRNDMCECTKYNLRGTNESSRA